MYIGFIVFRLLKLSDELDIKTSTLLNGTTILMGGGQPLRHPLIIALLCDAPLLKILFNLYRALVT